MSLNNSLDNIVKEAQSNNGEGLSPSRCPVSEQCRHGHHQTTVRMKWTKEDNNFAITCYLKAKEERKKGDIENECTNTG